MWVLSPKCRHSVRIFVRDFTRPRHHTEIVNGAHPVAGARSLYPRHVRASMLPKKRLTIHTMHFKQALLCSVELGSIKCNLETAKIRRKTWQLMSRHCQNWNSHTYKIG